MSVLIWLAMNPPKPTKPRVFLRPCGEGYELVAFEPHYLWP